jgi:hypothetical protein
LAFGRSSGIRVHIPLKGPLEALGIPLLRIPMKRASWNPIADLRTLLVLIRYFRRHRADVLLAYTAKPIVYGCLAGRLTGIRRRYALITGLGYAFTDRVKTEWRTAFLKSVSIVLYRVALVGAERVIVYNQSDAEEVCRNRFINDNSKVTIVPGSGVDTQHFACSEPVINPPSF